MNRDEREVRNYKDFLCRDYIAGRRGIKKLWKRDGETGRENAKGRCRDKKKRNKETWKGVEETGRWGLKVSLIGNVVNHGWMWAAQGTAAVKKTKMAPRGGVEGHVSYTVMCVQEYSVLATL
jgi:hypothetical protein